jgi:hypothetical protein
MRGSKKKLFSRRPIAAAALAILVSSCNTNTQSERDGEGDDVAVVSDVRDADLPYDPQPDPLPDLLPDLLQDLLPDSPPDFPEDFPIEDATPVTAEVFCATLVNSFCDYFNRCCDEGERGILLLYSNVLCVDPPAGPQYNACLQDPGEAIRNGTIVVYDTGLSFLEDGIYSATASCPGLGNSPLMKYYYNTWVTGEVLLGQLEEGARCSYKEECLEDLFCSTFTGLCTVRARRGDVCREDLQCNLGDVCAGGRCAEPGQNGEQCDRSDECAAGSWCSGEVCADMLPPGAPCSVGSMNCQGSCTYEYPYVCIDFCDGI